VAALVCGGLFFEKGDNFLAVGKKVVNLRGGSRLGTLGPNGVRKQMGGGGKGSLEGQGKRSTAPPEEKFSAIWGVNDG